MHYALLFTLSVIYTYIYPFIPWFHFTESRVNHNASIMSILTTELFLFASLRLFLFFLLCSDLWLFLGNIMVFNELFFYYGYAQTKQELKIQTHNFFHNLCFLSFLANVINKNWILRCHNWHLYLRQCYTVNLYNINKDLFYYKAFIL